MNIKESEITEKLCENMVRYIELKNQIDICAEEQEALKSQNLDLVKLMGLKKGDCAEFEEIGLKIQLIEMVKKIGINEDGLVSKYGKEKTDYLKVIPIKAVELAIKIGKLPDEAVNFIIKDDPIEYTKITKI